MADIPSLDKVTLANDRRQTQFLTVITRDEATERFQRHLKLEPLGNESLLLADALNRVLVDDVIAEVDVPGFDRSNVDGFAVQASDTFGAGEEDLRSVALNTEVLTPGMVPTQVVGLNRATVVATGAMLPRGADAVVMVEHTEVAVGPDGARAVEINRALTAGENVSYAGTDIARGETVLRGGQILTSREIGVLAAIGIDRVACAAGRAWPSSRPATRSCPRAPRCRWARFTTPTQRSLVLPWPSLAGSLCTWAWFATTNRRWRWR